jgi:hypothetical protein
MLSRDGRSSIINNDGSDGSSKSSNNNNNKEDDNDNDDDYDVTASQPSTIKLKVMKLCPSPARPAISSKPVSIILLKSLSGITHPIMGGKGPLFYSFNSSNLPSCYISNYSDINNANSDVCNNYDPDYTSTSSITSYSVNIKSP